MQDNVSFTARSSHGALMQYGRAMIRPCDQGAAIVPADQLERPVVPTVLGIPDVAKAISAIPYATLCRHCPQDQQRHASADLILYSSER